MLGIDLILIVILLVVIMAAVMIINKPDDYYTETKKYSEEVNYRTEETFNHTDAGADFSKEKIDANGLQVEDYEGGQYDEDFVETAQPNAIRVGKNAKSGAIDEKDIDLNGADVKTKRKNFDPNQSRDLETEAKG